MDPGQLLVFARVVQEGSFVGAARALDMPTSTVSRKVSQLEAHLDARLLNRTTRSLHLTDAGRMLFGFAARVAGELEEAEAAVARLQAEPRGLLRVTMPTSFSSLGSVLASFLQRYPEVQLEVACLNRVVDLVEEGFDLGIRGGQVGEGSLISRHLGVLRNVVVASPAYLAGRPPPAAPAELRDHACVGFGGLREPGRWTLQGPEGVVQVQVPLRMVVNDLDVIDQAVADGLGVAMVLQHRCAADLAAGRLVQLLPAWRSPDVPVRAVYPSRRHLSPKVVAFLDHLRERLGPAPWGAPAAR